MAYTLIPAVRRNTGPGNPCVEARAAGREASLPCMRDWLTSVKSASAWWEAYCAGLNSYGPIIAFWRSLSTEGRRFGYPLGETFRAWVLQFWRSLHLHSDLLNVEDP